MQKKENKKQEKFRKSFRVNNFQQGNYLHDIINLWLNKVKHLSLFLNIFIFFNNS